MNLPLVVLCLGAVGWIFTRLLRRSLPDAASEARSVAPKGQVAPPGPLFDVGVVMLPWYVRPGHGFLVLRDRMLDRLEIDGVDAGDPDAPHPKFSGSFRGYFNVPPGPHTLVAHWKGRSTTWHVEVEPNRAYVKRMDWQQGGWVDDDPETEEHYRRLALSGSMLQAQALREWPRPSLYFIAPPPSLIVNGRIFPCRGKFGGLINLPPGEVRIDTGSHSAGCTLPAESMQVIDFGSGAPTFVDPKIGGMRVRIELTAAPREALMTYEAFAKLATADEALRAAETNLDAARGVLSGAPVRQFGPEDLASYERAFASYRAQGPAGVRAYVEALRAHYVVDSAMAAQAPYFERYADRVNEHLKLAPELVATEALTYLRYLAEDLQDTGNASLAARGRALSMLMPNA